MLDFVWMEDFEDASLAIHESANSDTVMVRTEPAGAPEALIDDYSQYSGITTWMLTTHMFNWFQTMATGMDLFLTGVILFF